MLAVRWDRRCAGYQIPDTRCQIPDSGIRYLVSGIPHAVSQLATIERA